MNNDSTLACDGIETRFGSRVHRIHGIGHDENDWWVTVSLTDDPKIKRDYHPCYFVHEDTDEAKANMNAISKAVMDHLAEHGGWDKRGRWFENPKAGGRRLIATDDEPGFLEI